MKQRLALDSGGLGVGLALLASVLLAACGTSPPTSPAAPAAPQAPTSTPAVIADNSLKPGVLGRNERFLVYQPRADESLRSIAAQFLGSEDKHWMIGDANGISRVEAGQPLIVPLKPLNPIGVSADQYQTVPILCYHRFGGAPNKMAVSPSNFAAQLDWLARNDYRVIRLSQLMGFLQGREPLPKRSVVITIDDGYESTYRHALPALRKHNFPATLFVYTDFIGASDAVTWPQMQELVSSGLVDIQAHSKSHRNLIERTAADADDNRYRQNLEAEARVPREVLEKRLPVKVRHYAYPYGDANEQMLDILTRLQYEIGVTVNPGGNGFFAQPMMLRRTMIFGDHDIEAFKAKLQVSRGITP
jgi:peptidoglycan/xylan/chitin deacetylase (PgdA/CDA1 family)